MISKRKKKQYETEMFDNLKNQWENKVNKMRKKKVE